MESDRGMRGADRVGRRLVGLEGRPALVLRYSDLSLRFSARHDGPHQGPGDRGADRRRDHGPDQPVLRHDEIPRRHVPGRGTDRPRHAVRLRVGGPRQGAARAVGAGHQGALLRDRLVRHVEQRLHVDRQAQHRHRRGELPDRRAPLAGHGAGQCQAGLPVADAVRVGQRPDAGRRAEGLCGSEHAAEAVQADAAFRLGPAVCPARHRAGPCGRRHEDAARRTGEKDGRRRFLRTACSADEGQSPGSRRRADGREDEGARHRAGKGLRHQQGLIVAGPRPASRHGCVRHAGERREEADDRERLDRHPQELRQLRHRLR